MASAFWFAPVPREADSGAEASAPVRPRLVVRSPQDVSVARPLTPFVLP